MPGLEKIHLEDALEDNPQTRSMVTLFEHDAELLRDYIETLRSHCDKVLSAQKELASATSNLSQHLRAYENQKFPMDTDPDSVLKTTLREFAVTLDEISSLQQVCAAQLGDGMLFPLNRFIEADLTDIFTMMEMFKSASNEMEQSITRFCKCSRKRDSEKVRQEINEEVYMATKKYHQTALHYYANMNALQYKRKMALLEPVLGYLHALKSTFSVGHETLNTPELESFLTNIGSSIQGVQAELGQETQKTVELIDTIEQQSQHLYYAEPPVDMPYIPPNMGLSQKSGYLFLKTKFAGMVTKWEHVFVYTLGSKLMTMAKFEVAGSVIMELEKNITTLALENEDRRNVFQVSNGKKNVIFQALNGRERDEWIASIHNIAKEGSISKSLMRQSSRDKSSRQNTVEKSLSVSSNASSNDG
ncbi:DCC-interacting protein 13-alpha-like [Uloborus diversus]|nr:DCC-interacting protein 13-alpha-like [Uloborus diversus]